MIQSLRGFRDIFYPESKNFTYLENCARSVLDNLNYKEIRIPTVERKELFIKSTGETTDIVSKEMYSLEDAKGRLLALRPEATPSIVRAYIEKKLYASDPVQKFFFIGNMFRAERPQKGRYREFEQIDLEYIGNPNPAADAEVIIALNAILKKAEVEHYNIEINSLGCPKCRPVYRKKLLEFLNKNKDTLCDSCKVKIDKNPLRALDCRIDKAKVAEAAPKMELCSNCDSHFSNTKSFLESSDIKFAVNKNMVRGLDYYTKTVFEFKSEKAGAQDALAGGGRYDSLIKSMGGPNIPAIGWAMGVDRILNTVTSKDCGGLSAFVISTDEKSNLQAFNTMGILQSFGIKTDGGLFSQTLKSQMKAADRSGAKFAVIVGEEEIKTDSVTVKNLETGNQEKVDSTKLTYFMNENTK